MIKEWKRRKYKWIEPTVKVDVKRKHSYVELNFREKDALAC